MSDDESTSEIPQGLYYHAIAEQICENYKETKKFRKPMDAPAYRLANEYAIQFLLKHRMEFTEKLAVEESSSYLMERHNPMWIARRLKLDPNEAFFNQLIHALGKDNIQLTSSSAYSTNDEFPSVQQRSLPKVPSDIRGKEEQSKSAKRYREQEDDRRNLQSSDSGVFTEMLNGTTTELPEPEPKIEKHHHHHHHGPRPFFTALEDPTFDEKKDKAARLYTKKKKEKEPAPPRDWRNVPPSATHIDTTTNI